MIFKNAIPPFFDGFHFLLMICTLLGLGGSYISACQSMIVFLCWLGLPMFIFVHFVFLLFYKKNRKLFNGLSIVCIGLFCFLFRPQLQTSSVSEMVNTRASAIPITIMNYNIDDFNALIINGDHKNEVDLSRFRTFAKSLDSIDILCAQEVSYAGQISEILNLPNIHGVGGRSSAIFTKKPILQKGEVNFLNTSNSAVWADIQMTDSSILRIYSIHLESYKIRKDWTAFKAGSVTALFSILKKINLAACKRHQQALQVIEHAQQSPYPTVLTGDFNSLPSDALIRRLRLSFQDAFQQKGQGFGQTYRYGLPYFRLDYFFYDKKVQLLKYEVRKVDISDHYPMVCKILL